MIDLKELKALLDKKLEIMDKIMGVLKPSDEFETLRNESDIADVRLKNALFDAAPELLDKAESYDKLLDAIVCLNVPGTARNITIGDLEYTIIHLRNAKSVEGVSP